MSTRDESRGEEPLASSSSRHSSTFMPTVAHATSSISFIPPPDTLTQDEPGTVEAARQRFAKQSRYTSLLTFLRRGSKSKDAARLQEERMGDVTPSCLAEPPERCSDAPRTRGLRRDFSASTRRLLRPSGRGKPAQDPHEGIALDDRHLDRAEEEFQDKFQWAVLYENQRGFTFFSIPYYSSMGLLPFDPAPFTAPKYPTAVPSSSTAVMRGRVRSQGTLSFNEFPLPDGTWRWLSKKWMVDMSSDADRQVQHDGFEYNWVFRTCHWRTEAGKLSAGGFVRRRRWIRLMYRPAKARVRAEEAAVGDDLATPAEEPLIPDLLTAGLEAVGVDESVYDGGSEESAERNGSTDHRSWAGTWDDRTGRNYRRSGAPSLQPPSALGTISGSIYTRDDDPVFLGDPTEDWARCRAALRRLKRDGRILEAWKRWLGQTQTPIRSRSDGIAQQTADTLTSGALSTLSASGDLLVEEPASMSDTPPKEYVAAVLNDHVLDIVKLFVYPDTKARFFELIAYTGILPSLDVAPDTIAGETDFWSYTDSLNRAGESDAAVL